MRKVSILLQARTNSSRLPGKALLPINGLPTVVLAAKRAANTGLPVTIVTSEAPSDDALVRALEAHQVPYFRGSLDQPLARYVAASEGLPDNQIIVRLTGDNLLPDGKLVTQMLDYFDKHRLNYLGSTAVKSGMPYGVHIEVMRLVDLREAWSTSSHPYDIEHVTPYIIRKYGFTCFPNHEMVRAGHLRSTLDTLDDYLRLSELFLEVEDPISVDCVTLAKRLLTATLKFPKYSAASKLVLYLQKDMPQLLKAAKELGIMHVYSNGQLQAPISPVRVSSPSQLESLLLNEAVNWIQMPFSLFDHRWDAVIPKIAMAKRLRVLTIEVYDEYLWKMLQGDALGQVSDQIASCEKYASRESPLDLMLAFLRYFDWIDGIACPIDSEATLHAVHSLFYKPALLTAEIEHIQSMPVCEEYES